MDFNFPDINWKRLISAVSVHLTKRYEAGITKKRLEPSKKKSHLDEDVTRCGTHSSKPLATPLLLISFQPKQANLVLQARIAG